MMTKNTKFPLKVIALRLLTAIFIVSIPIPTRAQLRPGYQVSIKFPTPENKGAPARTEPGGRRGSCDADISKTESNLIAVTPKNNVITTVVSNPAVYIYVPRNVNKQAEFLIFDNDEKSKPYIYKTTFSLPNQAAIVKVSLPKVLNLQSEKTYKWNLQLICNHEDGRDKDPFVEGFIKPRLLNSEQLTEIQQRQQQPLLQAKLYVEYGIWSEVIDILTSLNNNFDTQKEWQELLESVELKAIINAPIINLQAESL